MKYKGIFLVAALVAASSCLPGTSKAPGDDSRRLDTSLFSGVAALEQVAGLVSIVPRHSGSPGAARAAEYIASRLTAAGLKPGIIEFEDVTPAGRMLFRNVVATLPGKNEDTVILLSHYDTKSGISETFAGANDSGSSTGLLLELAAYFSNHEPPVGIMFAFVDGEECLNEYGDSDGLHGSRHLAGYLEGNGRLSGIKAVFAVDMVGDRDLTVTLPGNSTPSLVSMLFDAAEEEGVRGKFGLARGEILDDHVPFLARGVPAVAVIDFEYGSARGLNDYWHTEEDAMDKLDAGSLEVVGRVLIRAVDMFPCR